MDDEPEAGRWLGYSELAELRGISKASATRMAFRYRWRRQEGNDGTARVFVPLSALHGKGSGSAMERMAAAIETAMGLLRKHARNEPKSPQRSSEAGQTARNRTSTASDPAPMGCSTASTSRCRSPMSCAELRTPVARSACCGGLGRHGGGSDLPYLY